MNHEQFVYINDSFVPREHASLRVDDLAIQRGYGIFDFLKLDGARPIFLDDHLDRFETSAARMRLPVGKTRDQLKTVLMELIARNAMPDSGIRLTLTGGYAADGYTIAAPNLVIVQQPLRVNPNLAATGIRLATYPHQRQLPDVKTIDYLMAIWLQPYVAQRHADDVLYHQGGIITECPRSNVFLLTRDDRLVTPARNILCGITRKHVLALARARDAFTIEQRDVHLSELHHAREAFITSTTKGLLPVVAIDGRPIANGQPGPATQHLRAALTQLCERNGAAS